MKYNKKDQETIFNDIIERIENGSSLRQAIIDMANDMVIKFSRQTFYDWIEENEDLADRYARACDARYDYLLDEIFAIADDKSQDSITVSKGDYDYEIENKEFINRSRTRIDVRKWALSKLAPKKFGDRLEVDAKVQSETKVKIDYDKLSDEALEEIVNAAKYAEGNKH